MTSLNPSFLSRVAGQAGYYILSFGINAVGRYYMLALLWRSLDFSHQQSYAKLQVALSLFCVLADFGLENAVIRFFAKDKSITGFVSSRLKRLGIMVLLPAALIFGVWWKMQFDSWAGFAVCLCGIGYAFFQIAAAFSRAETNARAFAGLNLVRNGASIAIIAGLFYGLKTLTLESWFLTQALVALAMTIILMMQTGRKHQDAAPAGETRTFSRYSTIVFAANVILWLESLWDIFFINHFRPDQLPVYQLVIDYGSFIGMATMLISKAWPAMYFTMVADQSSSQSIAKRLINMHWIAGFGLLLLFILAPPGMYLLRGQALPFALFPVLALMLSTQALIVLLSILRPMLEFKNDVGAIAILFAIAVTMTLVLNALLVSHFGILGTAFSGIISAGFLFWTFLLRLKNNGTISQNRIIPILAGQQALFGFLMVAASMVLPRLYPVLLPGMH